MKKIAYTLIILVALICIILGIAVFKLNTIVAYIKPQIEQTASQAMSKPVTIDDISITLFPTTKINLTNLALGEEGQKFLLESLSVDIDLYSIISKGVSLDSTKGSLTNLTVSGSFKDLLKITKAHTPSLDFEIGKQFSAMGDFQYDALALGTPAVGTFKAKMSKENIILPQMNLALLSGTVSAPLTFTFLDKSFSTPLTIRGIDIDKALSTVLGGKDSKVFGDLTSVDGRIAGVIGATLMNSLQGGFNFKVSNGGIRGVNIGGLALKEVKDLPIIQGSLFTYVPEGYRAILQDENTEFSELTGDISIKSGKMSTQNIKLISKAYTVEAKGILGFDSSVDLNALITFSKDFTDGLVKASPGFQRVLSAEGNLVFPLSIKGVVPKVLVVPDISKLIEIAGKRILKDKAADVLDKALGNNAGKILKNLW